MVDLDLVFVGFTDRVDNSISIVAVVGDIDRCAVADEMIFFIIKMT